MVGFPHGDHLTPVKVLEAELAIDDGAVDLDMVLNIGKLLSRDFDYVENDIRTVCEAAHRRNVLVKVILENAYLTDELKKKGCELAERTGADYVKTSTDFAPSGATIEDLILMKNSVSSKIKLKAAGGVRTLDEALLVRATETNRIGVSATKAIMDEAIKREQEGTLKEAVLTKPVQLGTEY